MSERGGYGGRIRCWCYWEDMVSMRCRLGMVPLRSEHLEPRDVLRAPCKPDTRSPSLALVPILYASPPILRTIDAFLLTARFFPLVAPQLLPPKTRGSPRHRWPAPQTRVTSKIPSFHGSLVGLDHIAMVSLRSTFLYLLSLSTVSPFTLAP